MRSPRQVLPYLTPSSLSLSLSLSLSFSLLLSRTHKHTHTYTLTKAHAVSQSWGRGLVIYDPLCSSYIHHCHYYQWRIWQQERTACCVCVCVCVSVCVCLCALVCLCVCVCSTRQYVITGNLNQFICACSECWGCLCLWLCACLRFPHLHIGIWVHELILTLLIRIHSLTAKFHRRCK